MLCFLSCFSCAFLHTQQHFSYVLSWFVCKRIQIMQTFFSYSYKLYIYIIPFLWHKKTTQHTSAVLPHT